MFEYGHIFKKWHASYVGYNEVVMPPGWKNEERVKYIFVFVNSELSSAEYIDFFKLIIKNNIVNAKLFTPRTLKYASILHPAFYNAVIHNKRSEIASFKSFLNKNRPIQFCFKMDMNLDHGPIKFWLQSVVFLAGVTLSAAIIQNRWSIGTLESKLNRLWQVASYGEHEGFEKLDALNIRDFVLTSAKQINENPSQVLFDLKKMYSKVLAALQEEDNVEKRAMNEIQLNDAQKDKYGFIENLSNEIGANLQTVLLYGSAVNSEKFADYDLIVVVKDLESALVALQGKSPMYRGLELNISVFNESDFWTYQLTSGDNLFDHAICLYGSIMVPQKNRENLVIRNFSFGYVRFLQLMGMAAKVGSISTHTDDKRNLIDYFIKIPLNVYKGIQGCYEKVGTNEEIKDWSKTYLKFDVKEHQEFARNNDPVNSLAMATWATQEVMHQFDMREHIFTNAALETILYKENHQTQHAIVSY